MVIYCPYCYLEVEVGKLGECPECGTPLIRIKENTWNPDKWYEEEEEDYENF